MNKDLTQKMVVLSDDEHESKDDELETVPDFVNDPEPIIDSVNPWMKGQLTREQPEVMCATPEVMCATPEEAETAVEENEEEELLGEFERKRKLRQADEEDSTPAEEKGMRHENSLHTNFNSVIVYSPSCCSPALYDFYLLVKQGTLVSKSNIFI